MANTLFDFSMNKSRRWFILFSSFKTWHKTGELF